MKFAGHFSKTGRKPAKKPRKSAKFAEFQQFENRRTRQNQTSGVCEGFLIGDDIILIFFLRAL